MVVALTVIHILVCVFLILVVLLQTGKGADLAGAFGGSGSQTAFGARGAATLLSKLTTGSVIVFMFTSFSLAIMANRSSRSVVDDAQQQEAPLVPGTDSQPSPGSTAGEDGADGHEGHDHGQTPPPDDEGQQDEGGGGEDPPDSGA